MKHRLVLLYDCDARKPTKDSGLLSIRTIPKNEENTKVKRGIENLFPAELFDERFYGRREQMDDYGASTIIRDFKKVDFCRWVCDEGKTAQNFKNFSVIVDILDEILESTGAP